MKILGNYDFSHFGLVFCKKNLVVNFLVGTKKLSHITFFLILSSSLTETTLLTSSLITQLKPKFGSHLLFCIEIHILFRSQFWIGAWQKD